LAAFTTKTFESSLSSTNRFPRGPWTIFSGYEIGALESKITPEERSSETAGWNTGRPQTVADSKTKMAIDNNGNVGLAGVMTITYNKKKAVRVFSQ
jgi:hypothetical protein